MCILERFALGQKFRTRRIKVGGKSLDALMADTGLKATFGLMYRKGLKSNQCMLFSFPRARRHEIWTYNMKFPIDIMWADDERVIDFAQNAEPCANVLRCRVYRPRTGSRYVIETAAGFVKKNRIRTNSLVQLR